MARAARIENLDRTLEIFARLEPSARDELKVTLSTIGEAVQEQQRARAPAKSGKLRSEIKVESRPSQLRVLIGLIGKYDAFYGRFVNFGRRAQTVLVQRRRRVDGSLRTLRRRKRAEDIVSTYRLRVKAREAKPFIALAPEMERSVDTALGDFWSRVLRRAGA